MMQRIKLMKRLTLVFLIYFPRNGTGTCMKPLAFNSATPCPPYLKNIRSGTEIQERHFRLCSRWRHRPSYFVVSASPVDEPQDNDPIPTPTPSPESEAGVFMSSLLKPTDEDRVPTSTQTTDPESKEAGFYVSTFLKTAGDNDSRPTSTPTQGGRKAPVDSPFVARQEVVARREGDASTDRDVTSGAGQRDNRDDTFRLPSQRKQQGGERGESFRERKSLINNNNDRMMSEINEFSLVGLFTSSQSYAIGGVSLVAALVFVIYVYLSGGISSGASGASRYYDEDDRPGAMYMETSEGTPRKAFDLFRFRYVDVE